LSPLAAVCRGTLRRGRSHLPLLFIGMQHVQLNNHKLGFEYLQTAWDMCTLDPLLANELGVAYYWLGAYDKALTYLLQTIELVEAGQGSEAAWYATYVNLGHAYRKLRCVRFRIVSAP
jgi:anaphase-promoting complex subunit 6